MCDVHRWLSALPQLCVRIQLWVFSVVFRDLLFGQSDYVASCCVCGPFQLQLHLLAESVVFGQAMQTTKHFWSCWARCPMCGIHVHRCKCVFAKAFNPQVRGMPLEVAICRSVNMSFIFALDAADGARIGTPDPPIRIWLRATPRACNP